MRVRRLISMFNSDADYWRLILFLFEVALILGTALVILAPHETFSAGDFIITPFKLEVKVDYGQSRSPIVFPAAGSGLMKNITLDEGGGKTAR